MEPSGAELKAFATVGAFLDWAPTREECRAAHFTGIWAADEGPVRTLAACDEADVIERDRLKVAGPPLTPAQKGEVVSDWRLARAAVGL